MKSLSISHRRLCAAGILLAAITQPALAQSNTVHLHPFNQPPSASFNASAASGSSAVVPTGPRAQSIADVLLQTLLLPKPANPNPPAIAQHLTLQKKALADLIQRTATPIEVHLRKENSTPFQIKGPLLEKQSANALRGALDRDEITARNFLRANRSLLLINDPDQELAFIAKDTDDLGRRHLRFSQVYKSVPVWPCELTVHLDANGNVDLMDGAFIPTPASVGTTPVITPDQAVQLAKSQLAAADPVQTTDPSLIIYGPLTGPARLAWRLNTSLGFLSGWRFIIDAATGEVLSKITLTPHAAETGSGADGSGQVRALNVWKDGSTYYMINAAKPMFDPTSTPPDPNKTRGAIVIMDSHNTPATDNPKNLGDAVLATSTSATSGWTPDAVGAAFGLSATYDYYRDHHNRNSLDGKGGTIVAIVRIGIKFGNAFWNGPNNVMAFGDGYTKAIDVSGHELTHGVIDSIGNGGILEYHQQPGALNESLADIFGEMVETQVLGQPDWVLGKALGDPVRNMADPSSLEFSPGRKYPSKMSEFIQLPDSSDADQGGVHINSSIINHCYYLLAAGLKDPLGLRDAERIFYRTMTLHLQKQSQFIDMRHGCLASAEELFGKDSTQFRKTAEAFDAVEIGDAPVTPDPAPIPVVQGDDAALGLRYEPSLGLWYMVRHETAKADPASGQLVETMNFLSPRRVAVSGDGSFVLYVTFDNDVGIALTDGSSAQLLGFPGTVYSIALAPDGSRFAFVLLDLLGNPSNEINVTEISTKKTRTIKLYVPGTEGAKLDIVKFADSMDFLPNGQGLIYDAYSEFKTKDGSVFSGWTLFGLDLSNDTVSMLIDLNPGLDFGNPSLGNVHPYLLTYETINKTNNLSTLYIGNLQTGETKPIASISQPNYLGTPAFNGDDSAVIYSQVDHSVNSDMSLVRQALSPGTINPAGTPAPWLKDAAFGAVYRRGAFVSSNSLPHVSIASPAPGQTFAPGATITFQATAADPDGTIAKVEFYAGSSKLGEDTSAPYSFAWSNPTAGRYRCVARAYDNLGAAADSDPVDVIVTSPETAPLKITTLQLAADKASELAFNGSAGKNYSIEATTDFKIWKSIAAVAATGPSSTFRDLEAKNYPKRFYRISTGSSGTSTNIITNNAPVIATMPEPGKLYPEGTRFGGSLFGVEFGIPPKWKGGLQPNTSIMIFGSDTEPGVVLAAIGFAWTKDTILNDPSLRAGITVDTGNNKKLVFLPTNPAAPLTSTAADRLSGDFTAQTVDTNGAPVVVYLGLDIVIHPSGGLVLFLGATTDQFKTQMRGTLKAFGDATTTTPRNTNTEYVNFLNGRSYKWAATGTDWYSNHPGVYSTSASLSSWGNSYGFFCASGTFQITTTKETIAGATSPTSGYSGISYSSTTHEYGQWTIVKTQDYGDVLLMVTLSGFQVAPVKISPDGTLFVGPNQLAYDGPFTCQ